MSESYVQSAAAALPSPCWSGVFTADFCCRGYPLGNNACWSSEFTFEKCCVSQECKSSLSEDWARIKQASSRLIHLDVAGYAVDRFAGNAQICDSADGELHSGLVMFEEKPVITCALCVPSTCSTEAEKAWIFHWQFGHLFEAFKPTTVHLKKLEGLRGMLVTLATSPALPLASLLFGVVLLASVLDSENPKSAFVRAFSLHRSLFSLFDDSAQHNIFAVDLVRALLTFCTLAGHVAWLTEWSGQRPGLWSDERCSKQLPFWLCILIQSTRWNNPGFVILSSFLSAHSLPLQRGLPSACWAFRRLARSYLRQVAQLLGAGSFFAIAVASMPYHPSVENLWKISAFKTAADNWLVDGFLLGPLLGIEVYDPFNWRIGEMLEAQLVIQVALVVPLTVLLGIFAKPYSFVIAGVGIAYAWTLAVPPINSFHTPSELIVPAIAGFVLGFIFPDRNWKLPISVAASLGLCGLFAALLPMTADDEKLLKGLQVELPGTKLYQHLKSSWSLAPIVVFSLGFSMVLASLIQICSSSSSLLERSALKPKVLVISRLSLGIIINHLQLIEVVKAVGLSHEHLPCTVYAYSMWLISICLCSAVAASIQWCFLEAPTVALSRLL